MAAVNPYASYLEAHSGAITSLIQELVECESPSDSADAVNRLVELLTERTRDIAKASTIEAPGFGRHLRLEFLLPGSGQAEEQVLAIGHSDTVWPMGTLRQMPFREEEGRLWGPGVLDMKAGIVFFLFAMRALLQQGITVGRRVVLLLVSDEEVGSPASRWVTEEEAKKSKCVLVLEPGTGLAGKLKTARKGIANYEIKIHGRAAHSGVDYENGASAVVEAARQIPMIAGWTDLKRGTTVNPGVFRGGTRSNVVAAEALVEVDVRIKTLDAWREIDDSIRKLQPFDQRCRIEINGGLNRPPMVRSDPIGDLFERVRSLAGEIGYSLEESETGGGSDGNFTAALGIPTLDGLGAVGEGAHARNESVVVSRITERISILAHLVKYLTWA